MTIKDCHSHDLTIKLTFETYSPETIYDQNDLGSVDLHNLTLENNDCDGVCILIKTYQNLFLDYSKFLFNEIAYPTLKIDQKS